MSYRTDENFITDLLKRKEYISLKSDPTNKFREARDDDIFAGKFLKVHSHQLFVRNFMNPNTPYKRLHLMHATGTGKTLAAIVVSQTFIRMYHKLYTTNIARLGRKDPDAISPMVFVLGFGGTKAAFVRDLLNYPEFGYISVQEKEELKVRVKIAESGLADDIKYLKDYISQIKRHITNKNRGGFYKFMGYDEFVNKLFVSDTIKLIDLEAEIKQRNLQGENITLEDIIYENIKKGTIKVNKTLINTFENSLLICDEIHNTYNMNMKNNRGVAIQYLLDTVPSLRFLSLSATPVNNSPTEIIELMNYLISPDKKITKKEFFMNSRNLYPGKLEELGRLSVGKISFLQDTNLKYFPRRIFKGTPLILNEPIEEFKAGDSLPYLLFIECPMSELHHNTLVAYSNELKAKEESKLAIEINVSVEDELTDTAQERDTYGIPTDGYYIYDTVFPNPESESVGLFRSIDIRNKISTASQVWRDTNKINIKKFSTINDIITGDFLSKDIIGKYSTKYKTLIELVYKIIKESDNDSTKVQKIMIYHDRVKISGVLLIQELLRANGLLDEFSDPIDTTICCICCTVLKNHTTDHQFKAARFVMAHSDIEKTVMDVSLNKFNSPENRNGLNYLILVGSKIIKESYDFKDIQNLILMSLPVNIPTMLQVFGRCIRKNSHILLPPEQRQTKISILISTSNSNSQSGPTILSPEVKRYAIKLSDYLIIQRIERELNSNAIDSDIHRDIIMPPELKETYMRNGQIVDTIGNLYFEPKNTVPTNSSEISTITFSSYRYHEEEIRTIIYIIKRLFMGEPIWTYNDLWNAVKSPPIGIEINPKLFSEDNFVICLSILMDNHPTFWLVTTAAGSATP